jgi:wobble nucleotide-excising tRNase
MAFFIIQVGWAIKRETPMFERFESINKVGLFESYAHVSGCEFGLFTLIYGENGFGKSTLAAILDSLRERNAGEIIRRRSLPGDVAPTVTVSLGGGNFIFNGREWDGQPPPDTIDVFYPGFVTRNVHASSTVDTEHHRNLCEFVLGRTAVEKVARLAQADCEGRAALTELHSVERALQALIKPPDTLSTFLTLPNDVDIDKHVEQTRVELKQAQGRETILSRTIPQAVTLPEIDQGAIAAFLAKNSESIGVDAADVVKAHIKQHLDGNGEKWLEYGAKHTGADNKCPFCAQDISRSDLVAAIRSYFSEEYRAFTEALSRESKVIRDQLGMVAFQHIRADITAQVAAASQWVREISFDQSAIAATLTEAETNWGHAAKELEEVLVSKHSNPLAKMELSSAETALAKYGHAIVSLAKINDILLEIYRGAQRQKAALSGVDTKVIEQRLHHIENQKTRFEKPAQDLIFKRNALAGQREKIEGEKKALRKEIEVHASRVVSKYQSGINYYLEYFGCDIRIESVETGFSGGKASVQYVLKAHGHEIELGLSMAEPCFETVLSEGDKYTLALAFFLARLKDHADLSGRTVVLDDPVNSFGKSRRRLIVEVIRDLRTRGAQVVVLTHDERLAAMIWRDRGFKNIVPLQVERTGRGSKLLLWDIERATQTEYVRNYLTLHDFLENGGDHRPAASCIRIYVEQRLRYLYPGPHFHTRDTLGQMIGKIHNCATGSSLFALKVKLRELDAINSAGTPSHHATDDVFGMPQLDPDETRLFARKALDVLELPVQDSEDDIPKAAS